MVKLKYRHNYFGAKLCKKKMWLNIVIITTLQSCFSLFKNSYIYSYENNCYLYCNVEL